MADNPYSDLLPEQDDNPYSDLVPGTPIQAHENFLQKAIKSAGGALHGASVFRDGFMNTAALGMPQMMNDAMDKVMPISPGVAQEYQQMGMEPGLAQPQNGDEKLLQGMGDAGGFMLGGPGKIMQDVEQKVAGNAPNFIQKLISRIAGGAAGGFTAGGDMNARKNQAGIGALLGPAFGTASDAVGGIKGALSTKPVVQEAAMNQEVGGELAGEADRLNKVKDYLETRGQREVGNVEAKSKGVDESFDSQNQDLKKQFGDQKNAYAYEASKGVRSKIDDAFSKARENYAGAVRSFDSENADLNDLLKSIDETIKAKKISRSQLFPDSAENRLLDLRDQIASKLPEAQAPVEEVRDPVTNEVISQPAAEAESAPKVKDMRDFKNFKNKVLDTVSAREDLQGEFLNHFSKTKGASALDAANEPYRKAYSAYNASKKLRPSAFNRVVSGKAQDAELSDLGDAEDKTGTDYVSQGKKLRESFEANRSRLNQNYDAQKNDLQKLIETKQQKYGASSKELGSRLNENDTAQGLTSDRIDQLNDRVEKIHKNRKVALASGGALGGLEELLRHIFKHSDY